MIKTVKPIDSDIIYDKAYEYYCDNVTYVPSYRYGNMGDFGIRDAFSEGANWRIRVIWHYINKKPIKNYTLIIIKSDKTLSEIYYDDTNNWKDFVKDMDIKTWCYKQDLFFKG